MSTGSLLPFQPSLAQATNTRIDSACKHIQQCRVSTDDMMRFTGNDALELTRNKYRYCVHKDELVVGISRAWYPCVLAIPTILPRLTPAFSRQEYGDCRAACEQHGVPARHQQSGGARRHG